MSSHVFHEIYLHFNWHTKGDRPLLTPRLESLVHDFLRERCRRTKGVYFHGIGGTETHVHLAVNVEPFVCVSDLMGDLKGACSFEKTGARATSIWSGSAASEWSASVRNNLVGYWSTLPTRKNTMRGAAPRHGWSGLTRRWKRRAPQGRSRSPAKAG